MGEEARKSRQSSQKREIGKLASVKDPTRRERCRKSAKMFGYTYFPKLLTKKLSRDHVLILKRAEETIYRCGCFVFAMPRGVGKTQLMLILALWVVLYGKMKYILVITAEIDLARDFLQSIADELQDNELLLEDFPELKCFVALDGEPRKQGGQTVQHRKTKLRLSPKMIRFPSFSEIASTEAIIEAKSITSRLRGRGKRICGRRVRPQLVILDDIQNDALAASPSRVTKTLQTIYKTVLGMKGTGEGMATFCIGTVIQKNDVMDMLLDQKRSPEWRGCRCKMLYHFPDRMDLWEGEYRDLRTRSLLEYGDVRLASRFYRANRKEMTRGAEVAWRENFDPGEVDALQHAMELYLRDRESFQSECQNEPLVNIQEALRISLDTDNLSHLPQGVVPGWASGIYLGVDMQKYMAYYVVAAVGKDFTTSIIDWGTWPDQGKLDFSYRDKNIETWVNPFYTMEENVSNGIFQLLTQLGGKKWRCEGGGTKTLQGGLVDGGYKGDAVLATLLQPQFYGRYFVSYGRAPSVLRKQFFEYDPRRGKELAGHNLLLVDAVEPETKTDYQYVAVYTNEWKTQLSQMVSLPSGSPGSMTVFGSDLMRHVLYSRHLLSEYPEEITGRGISINAWQQVPNTENHLLDATVYALAAASFDDCRWNEKLAIVKTRSRQCVNRRIQ